MGLFNRIYTLKFHGEYNNLILVSTAEEWVNCFVVGALFQQSLPLTLCWCPS